MEVSNDDDDVILLVRLKLPASINLRLTLLVMRFTQYNISCISILKQAKPPRSDISRLEHKVLGHLRKNISILVHLADKGRAMVVMGSSDYDTKIKALLSDANT